MKALHAVGRGLRQIFRNPTTDFEPASRALAYRLSGGVEHSSLIWCRCGELLTPVVSSDSACPEVISLGCPHGHGSIAVWSGVLLPGEAESVH